MAHSAWPFVTGRLGYPVDKPRYCIAEVLRLGSGWCITAVGPTVLADEALVLQLHRLKSFSNTLLFRTLAAANFCTDEGDLLLSYAKSILRLSRRELQRPGVT